jgi:hypothetical protein
VGRIGNLPIVFVQNKDGKIDADSPVGAGVTTFIDGDNNTVSAVEITEGKSASMEFMKRQEK